MVAFIFLMFGFYLPFRRGIDFFDTLLLLVPYSLLSSLFCAPAVIGSVFEDGRRGITLWALGRGILYGFAANALILACGITTVLIKHRGVRIGLPPHAVLLCVEIISLLVSGLFAGIAVWACFAEDTADAAKRKVRVLFLALLCLLLIVPNYMPGPWQDWLALQLTTDRLARSILTLTPLIALIDILLILRVLGRVHPGERNSLKIW